MKRLFSFHLLIATLLLSTLACDATALQGLATATPTFPAVTPIVDATATSPAVEATDEPDAEEDPSENGTIAEAESTATDEPEVEDAEAEDAEVEDAEVEDAEADETPLARAADSVGATATIDTRSLRVRQTPTDGGEVIGGARRGDVFAVLAITSNGEWVQLDFSEVENAENDTGWVSSSFVEVVGDITTLAIVDVENVNEEGEVEVAAADEVDEVLSTQAVTSSVAISIGGPAITETGVQTTVETITAIDTLTETEVETDTLAAESETSASEPSDGEPTDNEADDEADDAEAVPEFPTVTPAASLRPATTPEAAVAFGTVATAGQRLNVRVEPDAEAEVVGRIYNGDRYPIVELTDDGAWARVAPADESNISPEENTNGGWVTTQFLVIDEQ